MESYQQQISAERYKIIMGRAKTFQQNMANTSVTPVKVFDTLPSRHIEEIELIRDVSRYLQKKKEEDIRKAAQAAMQDQKEPEKVKEIEKEDS